MTAKGTFPRQIFYTLAASGVGALLGIMTSIVVTRSLGPEGRGVYAVAIRAVFILIALGQCGLPEVMLSQMRSVPHRVGTLAANSLIVILLATLMGMGVLYGSYLCLADSIFKGVSLPLLLVAFLMLPFNLGFLFFTRLIQLDGRMGAYNALRLFQLASGLLAAWLLLHLWPHQPVAAVLALVASQVLAMLISVIEVRVRVAPSKWRFDGSLLFESLRGGFRLQPGIVAAILGQSIGLFILNDLMSLRHVGLFAVALGLANFLLLFSQSAATVLQAWMPGEGNTSDYVAQKTVLIARHTVSVLLVGALVLAVVGLPLIRVMYGSEFQAAYSPMVILLAGVIMKGINQVTVGYLLYKRRLGFCSLSSCLAVAINLILALSLVPLLGMYGAALGIVVGQLVSTLLLVGVFTSMTKHSWSEFLPRASDFGHYVRIAHRLCTTVSKAS